MNRKPAYPKTVKAAAKALDVIMPSWYKKISIHKLNMYRGNTCVLGQLYGEYTFGKRTFANGENMLSSNDTAFGHNVDRELWVAEIKARRRASRWNEALLARAGIKQPEAPKLVEVDMLVEVYRLLERLQANGINVTVTDDNIMVNVRKKG